jgi:hypothetical protein
MSQPIKAGDMCRVISGLAGARSPNIGLIVTVVEYRGEHSLHGPIWRCQAEYAELGQPGVNVPPGTADFAQSWLKKIEPPAQAKTTDTTLTKELTP